MQRYPSRFEETAFALMRVVLGFLYWSHGPRWLFGAFDGNPVPLTSIFGIAGMIEIVFGTLIVFGLMTRFAAFIASGEMAVAYFYAHLPRGSWMPIINGSEITVALCFAFLYILARGGGKISVDGWLASRRKGA